MYEIFECFLSNIINEQEVKHEKYRNKYRVYKA